MPANECPRRKRLYQGNLDKAHDFLRQARGQLKGPDAGRVGEAMTAWALIEDLEAILIPFVLIGVGRDLALLKKSNALLTTGAPGPNGTAGPPPLAQVMPPGGGAAATKYDIDANISSTQAYSRYFDWYIDPPDVGNGTSGVAAFFQRYPLLDHSVTLATQHHQKNVVEACGRIATYWGDITKAFFPANAPTALRRIRTTGNDFHKGGKQVLILEFDLTDHTVGRVVYKPSPVEIDCRVLGNTAIVNAVAPRGDKDAAGYNQPASLTEILNTHGAPSRDPWTATSVGYTRQPLPTYVVLPYNRGALTDSFGFIEYLDHGPSIDVSGTPERIGALVGAEITRRAALDPTLVSTSDWIVSSVAAEQQFHHQLGGVMAMALAVSLSDLHLQNLIVHRGAPHLIDVEEALKKPMQRISDTYLFGPPSSPIGRADNPDAPTLEVTGDHTSDLVVKAARVQGWGPNACTLYRYGRDSEGEPEAGPVELGTGKVNAEANRKAMIRGFSEMVRTLAEPTCNDAVKDWAKGLRATFARYVTRATVAYAGTLRSLPFVQPELVVKSGDDAWYDTVRTADGVDFFFRTAVSGQRSAWAGSTEKWHPNFSAIEHPNHVWRDYLNLDVPAFYHLLGSQDLLNSAGQVVDVAKAVTWQNQNITVRPLLEHQDSAYLPRVPVDVVLQQLDDLKVVCAAPDGYRAYVRQALGTKLVQPYGGALRKAVPTPSSSSSGSPASGTHS